MSGRSKYTKPPSAKPPSAKPPSAKPSPAEKPAPRTKPSESEKSAGHPGLPWMLLVIGAAIMVLAFYRRYLYAWTQDETPGWAKWSVVYLGLFGTITLVHAMLAVQIHAASGGAGAPDRKAVSQPYVRAASFVGAGALVGTLLALFATAALPAGMKATALISDLALVGSVFGLFLTTPFNVYLVYRVLWKLRKAKARGFGRLWSSLMVTNLAIQANLITILPDPLWVPLTVLAFI